MTDLLFVYGTLRQGVSSPMDAEMRTHCTFIASGSVQGQLYNIGHYPGMVHSNVRTERVFGDVFRMKFASRVLPALDAYEGCAADSPKPYEYSRELQIVRLVTGRTIEAWCYMYMYDVSKLRRISGGDYLRKVSM